MKKNLEDVQKIQDQHWIKDKKTRRSPDHPVVRAVFSLFADVAALAVTDSQSTSVLDVGCGNGFLQRALEKRFKRVVGLDYSQAMLDVNPCQEKILGSSTKLPFADKSFDVVVASHLLHHLQEQDRVLTLQEMKRVARLAVVSFEPNCHNVINMIFALVKSEERMAMEFSSSYMKSLFLKVGFPIVQINNQNWLLPNRSPIWSLPLGRFLNQTPLKKLGFDICTVASLAIR